MKAIVFLFSNFFVVTAGFAFLAENFLKRFGQKLSRVPANFPLRTTGGTRTPI